MRKGTYADFVNYIQNNTNLPKRDICLISYECWIKGMSLGEALVEAKKLYNAV